MERKSSLLINCHDSPESADTRNHGEKGRSDTKHLGLGGDDDVGVLNSGLTMNKNYSHLNIRHRMSETIRTKVTS